MSDDAGREATAGVVIGYGSVGRRHASTMAALVPTLAIVETKAEARAQAAADDPAATVAPDLAALEAAGFALAGAAAVIASWGPSHAPLFHALADRGVRRILCEKPMAASACDAQGMAERAEREGIVLAVHHYIRYAGLVPALRRTFAEHALGEPVQVVVEGGAACLLTNGIHWLDFASELFGAAPERVTSTAHGDPINPRSPELQLYGGTAVFGYPGGREAVLAFSSASSVAASARVYLRNAVVDLDGDLGAHVRRRDPAAVERFPAVTRTGAAAETLAQGTLPGVLGYLEGMHAAAAEAVRGAAPTCAASAGAAAATARIGALTSAREARHVRLPLDPASEAGRERWPIS